MKRFATLLIPICMLGAACVADYDTSTDSQNAESKDGGDEEPADASVAHPRGHAGHGGGGSHGNSPNLSYHNGPIMASGAYVEAIFWGPSWNNATFTGDKKTGLQSFYSGMGGSNYAGTNDEYTQTGGAHVSTSVTWGGSHTDLSTASGGASTGPILAEVCSQISNPRSDGYYAVYTDLPRGSAGYCAWHSTGTCGGVQVQFAFFWNLDGDSGCNPDDTSGLHSQGLAALANVTGHELSEALTDPHLNAWYDRQGAENSDKCAWSFGTPLINFSNGSQWKIQGNWSNAAYTGGFGYANNSGQNGCLDGGNYN